MRILVFFDLPNDTSADRREYRKFHKLLLKTGFLMLQESVYCRMLLTPSAGNAVLGVLRKNRPPCGIVQVLTVTEKQFAGMEYLTGEHHSEIIENDERLVVL